MDKQQHLKNMQKLLNEKFNKYIGLSFTNISRAVGINPDTLKSKLSTVKLLKHLMEFENFNEKELILGNYIEFVSLKTVRLKCDGKPKESMSFEQIKFNEIVKENWNTSKLRAKFLSTTFLFVVFEYESKDSSLDDKLYFRGFYLWQMPLDILDSEIKNIWETTKNIVSNGLEIEELKQGTKTVQTNNLPGLRFNGVAHVRPKASNASDKVQLPNGMLITKQAFWLNAEYIAKIINGMPMLKIKEQSETEPKLLSKFNIDRIKEKLEYPIYTFDDFTAIACTIVDNFELEYFNEDNVSAMDYKIHPNFILVKEISRPEEYFEQKIFEQGYFTKVINPIYDSSQFMRKIINLENSYDIVKVEEDTFITISKLNDAGVNKSDLIEFKESVEDFARYGKFYTWYSIEKEGFNHKLIDFGFQDIFYESLLKRPGAFKYFKINQTTFFVKSIDEIQISDLLLLLMEGNTSISIKELERKFMEQFNACINQEHIVYYSNQGALYYS
ncbi:MutH/Sau3AI family endonuclease, partial [Gottfriedia acidiceleris]|uniref:MutH/Sau3AI family endonuclease n=1 Tax=Gottfriedia acidiceleris TaxID=371036 RepID=UPI002FFDA279